MNEQESLARQFEPYRGPLRAVAYRMLGSLSEADDAVQEAWLRLSRTDISTVGSLEAWLRTVVARVCLDMLRARTSRREEPLGWAVTAPSQQDGPEQLDAASQTCQRALELTAVPGRPLSAAAGPAYVGLGEVACQRNELDIALRHVTEGITLCRQFVYTPPLAAGLATLAWIRQAAGDPACARDAMDQAVRAAPVPAGLLNPVPAQRARLQVAQGDLDAAVRWASENGLGADDEPDYPREPGHMVLARVQLARDLPVRALALLDRLHAAAAAQDRAGSLIEAGALRALALAASGEESAAVTALAGALILACPQGYVRVFTDEGLPMATLLGRLVAAQRAEPAAHRVPLDCLARLQRAFDAGHAGPDHGRAAPGQGIVEPLTSRELEVLEMLAAGRSNQAIARQLVITLDTVKKHVTHILGKLGAANRTEAVSRARQLGLIA